MAVYTGIERESIIIVNDAESTATVCTYQRAMQRRLEALAAERPEEVSIKKRYTDEDGLIVTVPKSWIKVKPPRKMSEAQRIAAAERLKGYSINSTV